MKLTPWFSALTQPPVRPGWYLCRNAATVEDDASKSLRYFDGHSWLWDGPRSEPSRFGTWEWDTNQWRGQVIDAADQGVAQANGTGS